MKRAFLLAGLIALLLASLTPALAQKKQVSSADADAVAELLAAGSTTVTLGDLVMDERFNNSPDWEDFEGDHSSGVQADGVYRISVNGSYYTWQTGGDSLTDVVIQAETQQNSKVLNNSYGVICRGDGDGNGYFFQIAGDGFFSIFKQTDPDEGLVPVVDWETSKFINQGRDNNHIIAVCVSDYLALYANGRLLAEANDSDLDEGFVGLTAGAFDDGNVDVSFDNLAVWEASGGKGSKNGGANLRVEHYNGEPDAVIAELRQLGLVPKGGSLLFQEDRAFFNGQGNFFTPLARRSPNTNIVMAGELNFSIGNLDEYEQCSLTARIGTNAAGDATTYVDVVLTNAGELGVIDRFSERADANIGLADGVYDISQPVHLLFVLIGDRINVFANGELALADFAVEERAGTYGISLIGKGPRAQCEGKNVWVYQFG
ncbi:MAG: hypothetical protein HZC41_00115 [Chloroflexi bacterium]|nr:hypothetical protein [Chloroflexota bacterium]